MAFASTLDMFLDVAALVGQTNFAHYTLVWLDYIFDYSKHAEDSLSRPNHLTPETWEV